MIILNRTVVVKIQLVPSSIQFVTMHTSGNSVKIKRAIAIILVIFP